MDSQPLLRSDRLRTIEKPFAWLPFRLIKDGFFENMTDRAKLLYTFLCLAADRQGVSFYGDAKIRSHFQLDNDELFSARKELIQKDLVAYDGRRYQVLSLPAPERRAKPAPHPPPCPPSTPSPTLRRNSQPESLADILDRLSQKFS